jgi:hypothetical protein
MNFGYEKTFWDTFVIFTGNPECQQLRISQYLKERIIAVKHDRVDIISIEFVNITNFN